MKQEKEDKSMTLMQVIKEYIDLKLEYCQLTFTEKISLLVGHIIFLMLLALLGLAGLLMIILLMYNLLMGWIGVSWIVSLIEIGFVGLLTVFFWTFREKLVIRPVAGMIVRMMIEPSGKFKTQDDDEIEE